MNLNKFYSLLVVFLSPFFLTPCLKAAHRLETEGKSDACPQSTLSIEIEPEKHASAVYDYTLPNGVVVDHVWDEQDSLEDDILLIANKLEDKETTLLGAALQSDQDGQWYKYLFSSQDPSKEQSSAEKAQKKCRYHIIKGGNSPHLMLQLLGGSKSQKNTVSKICTVIVLYASIVNSWVRSFLR